jgi:hypothetical protein
MAASPHEAPKLTAVGVGYLNDDSFGARLDRAIRLSDHAKLIEGRTLTVEKVRAIGDDE